MAPALFQFFREVGMTEKSLARADFYTAIFLIVFGITITVMALQMPPVTDKGQSPYSAPGILPTLLGIVITGLSAFMFVRSLRRIGKDVALPEGAVKSFFAGIPARRMAITLVLCVLYSLGLGNIDFVLLTSLFIFIFVLVFEYDRKQSIGTQKKKIFFAALLAVCASAAVMGTFQYLFLVNLP